jgi:restriction endonuclease
MQAQPYKSQQTHLSAAAEEAANQEIKRKLSKSVEEAFESVAKLTRLSVQEVLHILEEVDVAQLKQATQGAIKKISNATDLDAAHITATFMANSNASIDDIVNRLYEQSRANRHRL